MGAIRSPAAQPDDPGNPADLATRLDEVADTLDADYEEVIRLWPSTSDDEDVVIYWRAQTEKVKQDIDLVQHLADRCRRVTRGQPESGPLADLHGGLMKARVAVQAALRAYQARDEAGQFTSQSEHYVAAVGQLQKLASYCRPLATYLRGLPGLPDTSE